MDGIGKGIRWACLVGAVWCALLGRACAAQAAHPLHIYIDADFTHSSSVARGIELGIRAALHHAGVSDDFDIVIRDHRTNARRSRDNFAIAASDPRAIAVFGGKQSPPYLTFNATINALRIPVLLPWSAGAAITRLASGDDNWMFRVSVDDRQTGVFLAEQAVSRDCARPGAIVEDTAWGTGNLVAIRHGLIERSRVLVGSWRLEPNAGSAEAARLAAQLQESGADCLLLIGGSATSVPLIRQISRLPNPPLVLSHWGIYGQAALVDDLRVALARVNLRVLGTCGLERMADNQAALDAALASASAVTGRSVKMMEIQPPHAFFHAYDATLLLLAAVERAKGSASWEDGAAPRRAAIRDALYTLDDPINGLVKTYRRPFRQQGPEHPDGHEALGIDDLCMQRFDAVGQLRPGAQPGTAQVLR